MERSSEIVPLDVRGWARHLGCLIFLAVTATVTTAIPASSETRKPTIREWTVASRVTPADPADQRTSFSSAPARGARRRSPGDDRTDAREGWTYSQAIAEAATRYAVPERLVWAVIRAESGFDPR